MVHRRTAVISQGRLVDTKTCDRDVAVVIQKTMVVSGIRNEL